MTKTINGVNTSYSLNGSGNRKLLLLHGWGCDGTLMKPVAERMQDQFQILIPDFPGHGKSGRPPEPWGVPEYAEFLRQLLTEAETPVFFDKIIFTGAAGIRKKPSAEAKKRSERYKKLKNACEKLKKIPMMGQAAEKLEDKLRRKYGSADYNALDDEMRKTFVKVISLDLSDLYERFTSSTLLIWGDMDSETPLWMGQEMEKRIPDAGLVVLEGGTHFAYLEQLDRFAVIVRHFLKGDDESC